MRTGIVCLAVFAAGVTCVAGQDVKPGGFDLKIDKPAPGPAKGKPRGFQYLSNPNGIKIVSGKKNHVFYVGDEVRFDLAQLAHRYEVRDYNGDVVDSGPAGESVKLKVSLPGWYKLYVYGKPEKPRVAAKVDPLADILDRDQAKKTTPEEERLAAAKVLWGDVVGTTTFVIFRKDPNFPTMPPPDVKYGPNGNQIARGVTGMGPQRYQARCEKVEESIKNIEIDVELDKKYYLPYDPTRKRSLMIAFGDGTSKLVGVRQIVDRFKNDVTYWEPRNEPNFGASAADFVEKELKPFYELVKGVDPKLKVIGPGAVSYGQGLIGWTEEFFKAGGAKYIDAFSFHAYNCVNGDITLTRQTLEALNVLLKKYGAENLEKWQTEQGYFACVYGAFQPRIQGRWTMVQMMVYEQFGIPKEHNHLWYDTSHGFWDFPTWWENDDGGFNPAAPLMRVWSEELFGTTFSKAYDFGPAGKDLYVGSLFTGKYKKVAAFMSGGDTNGRVALKVKGGDKLQVTSAFGVESSIPVKDGVAVLPVPELPVYVRIADGQEIEVVPLDWGPNLARTAGVVVTASGSKEHPLTNPKAPANQRIKNDTSKLVNGVQENWYRTMNNDDQVWMSNVTEFPAWVELTLPEPTSVGRVVVYAAPPWQIQGTLLDYDLQIEREGKWVTVETVKEQPKTFKVFSPPTRTVVDSFFSDRWIFQHAFAAEKTSKIRLLVRDVTHGGGATADVGEAGGQTGLRQITLREIEVYAK